MDPLEENRMRDLTEEALRRYRVVQTLIACRDESDEGKAVLKQAVRAVGETLAEAREMVLRTPWDGWLTVLGIPTPAATTYMTAFEPTRIRH